jgi:hypothetical protein
VPTVAMVQLIGGGIPIHRDQYARVHCAVDLQLAASPARLNARTAAIAEGPGPGIARNRHPPAIGCDAGRLRRRLGPYALLSADAITHQQHLKAVALQVALGNERTRGYRRCLSEPFVSKFLGGPRVEPAVDPAPRRTPVFPISSPRWWPIQGGKQFCLST